MGQLHRFKCGKCEYETEVSGGLDGGMACISQATILCKTCQVIGNISIEPLPWGTGPDALDPKQLRCPVSPDHVVSLWTHPGPCPQCGTTLTQEETTLFWD